MKTILIVSTPQNYIGEMAKICYATKSLEDGGKDITGTLVHGHSHLAALRFAYAIVSVEGISIACQNQVVRSKHLDFMVQSKRYVNADKGEFTFIMPSGLNQIQTKLMSNQWDTAINNYKALISQGVKKEDARAILPANTSTKMNIAGNLQAWWNFFELRMNAHAQTEIRELAINIFDLLSNTYPDVFTEKLKLNMLNKT